MDADHNGAGALFRYYFQKFFFQIITISAFVLFLGIFVYAYSVEDANPPPLDVKIQFQNSLGKPLAGAGAGETDLSIQHLSGNEIAVYLDEVIADSMSFTPSDYQSKVAAMADYFTPQGYEQYKSYLTQSNFAQNLTANRLRSGAYSERPPIEVNSVVQNGVYKWLLEAPVTVSFLPLNASTYENGQTTAQNQRFTLRVQFTRVKNPENPNDIKIEIWQMLAPRK